MKIYEINRKVLTIDNMVQIIGDLTFSRKYDILIMSKEMWSLCELNSDFKEADAWNVKKIKVYKELREKEFILDYKYMEKR